MEYSYHPCPQYTSGNAVKGLGKDSAVNALRVAFRACLFFVQ